MSEIYPIAVPKWGIEMVEGTILAWNKEEGDTVGKGEELLEIESDKIVNVWESPVEGILRRRVVDEGETVPVGALLGVIAVAEMDDAGIDQFVKNFSRGDDAQDSGAEPAMPDQAVAAAEAAAARVASKPAGIAAAGEPSRRINPVARRLARDLGVDLDTVVGTGRNGRVTREDVELAAKEGAEPSGNGPAAATDVEVIPLSATRKTIGKRLVAATQEIPHYYLGTEYELDGLLSHREKLNQASEQRVSVNDLMVWCVARALKAVPQLNVNLVGDDIHQFKHANVAIAIDTDHGLYPATIYRADELTPYEIATSAAALSAKAKSGTLTKDDISGASFTVSNLGMFGVTTFSAIINPPACAILALGRGTQRVVVKEGEPAVATVVNATLSCDHRVIDGANGARFFDALRDQIAAL